jgi:hypothetical protein
MLKNSTHHNLDGIEFMVLYSARRTLGISVLPDSSVIVRVPYLTSKKTINRIVKEKSSWIIKHRDGYAGKKSTPQRTFTDGEIHFFRGNECILRIEKSSKPYIRFQDGLIGLGLDRTGDTGSIKRLLYKGYKNEALKVFPRMLDKALIDYNVQSFKPAGLKIRTMKRRWGSCSNKGIITLSTELIKLPDRLIEYVIVHELCHLKHHNHGARYYKLLSELFPDWKQVRKELRENIR